jgi:hypothetical protein
MKEIILSEKKKAIIRNDVNNKKKYVIDIYFGNREYPNIISGKYSSIKKAKEALYIYRTFGKIPWGE